MDIYCTYIDIEKKKQTNIKCEEKKVEEEGR